MSLCWCTLLLVSSCEHSIFSAWTWFCKRRKVRFHYFMLQSFDLSFVRKQLCSCITRLCTLHMFINMGIFEPYYFIFQINTKCFANDFFWDEWRDRGVASWIYQCGKKQVDKEWNGGNCRHRTIMNRMRL